MFKPSLGYMRTFPQKKKKNKNQKTKNNNNNNKKQKKTGKKLALKIWEVFQLLVSLLG